MEERTAESLMVSSLHKLLWKERAEEAEVAPAPQVVKRKGRELKEQDRAGRRRCQQEERKMKKDGPAMKRACMPHPVKGRDAEKGVYVTCAPTPTVRHQHPRVTERTAASAQ